ncbi:MAG: 1-deoxy-D-xylulose-5-phosphate synthase [Oscillospiraceae bacterium]|nr:1-deoxy-D-xylulose-5-phosphate synthase [Oscillospiraceae bacterium]
MILENISSPQDVKKLDHAQLDLLCGELRAFVVDSVSKTGGHLASNHGAVELTVAIHRVFDTARDRLVFDVGHQCYVHKALTGRRELFSTLRKFGGISGFPKPHESEHDAFIAGHASNSVSVALGMARARTLRGDDYSVIALIGDGALTGGLSYEGLNDAGSSGEPLIVILNDNGMSIASNVGAVSGHLSLLRTRPGYFRFKKTYRRILGYTDFGAKIYRFNHRIKTNLKKALFPNSSLFEDMGFTYLGPVDGHDTHQLTHVLRWARDLARPVVVHVHTVKGKGYAPAEEEPSSYHGVGVFDPERGVEMRESASFSSVFGEEICALAAQDARVCAITAAMTDGTMLTRFAKTYPDRFFDVGIAEAHAVTMAAGMAAQGIVPVFAVYSSFLQRAYDSLIHDAALSNLHVVLAVDRAGLVGADGETHHGCFDPLFLSGIPNMTVLCPASFAELRVMLRRAVLEMDGPVAVRYPRGGEGVYRDCCADAPVVTLRGGEDITLLGYGTMVDELLRASDILAQSGVRAGVVKLNQISPISRETAMEIGRCHRLLIAEECIGAGCVGQRIAGILAENGLAPKRLILKNLGKSIVAHGTVSELRHAAGLDAEAFVRCVMEVCHEQ